MTNDRDRLEIISSILFKCVVQFTVVLFLWWGVLAWFGEMAYNAHRRVTPLSRDTFNAIHYAGMLITKIAMGIFFLAPYIAIKLELKERAE
jgi:hypothetical protein